jgi:hypothetical protein
MPSTFMMALLVRSETHPCAKDGPALRQARSITDKLRNGIRILRGINPSFRPILNVPFAD